MISIEKDVSSELTILLQGDFGFELWKQHFWDVVLWRYGWCIANLPTICPCASRFSIQYCMNCKKEGFVSVRHTDLGDLTAKVLSDGTVSQVKQHG